MSKLLRMKLCAIIYDRMYISCVFIIELIQVQLLVANKQRTVRDFARDCFVRISKEKEVIQNPHY